jgi:hypothetical protein
MSQCSFTLLVAMDVAGELVRLVVEGGKTDIWRVGSL